jgi:hypothetical protein
MPNFNLRVLKKRKIKVIYWSWKWRGGLDTCMLGIRNADIILIRKSKKKMTIGKSLAWIAGLNFILKEQDENLWIRFSCSIY